MVSKDVAAALGYINPQKAIRDHVDEEDCTVNDLFTVNGTLINESGLYALVLSSKLPGAGLPYLFMHFPQQSGFATAPIKLYPRWPAAKVQESANIKKGFC